MALPMRQDDIAQLLRTSDVARRLNVTPFRVHQLVERGRIPVAMRTPYGRLFRSADVEAFLLARAQKPRRANSPIAS